MKAISEQLDIRLQEERKRGKIIDHNLEYGLGTENVVRTLIREMLPFKFGVGKGKIVNCHGITTRHLDLIIYDQINYPTLFLDEHRNQILPIESVYSVIEIKSRTTASLLKDAFENLASVATVAGNTPNCSTNDYLEYHPPCLSIFSFQDDRKLESICDNFKKLSQSFPRTYSFSRYSKKSPGSKGNTENFYLVHNILISGKGEIYHMLDGHVAIGRWGVNSFAMFITSLLSELSKVKLLDFFPPKYINWVQSGVREVYDNRRHENR